jgi:hypothetical protein
MALAAAQRVCFALAVCLLTLGATVPVVAQLEDLASERPPGESPTRVEVAFYLIDVMKVIDRDETFEADVFTHVSWNDPRLRDDRMRVVPAAEVWMPNVVIFNERAVSKRLPEVVEIQPDGTVTYRQRFIGTFASSLALSRFPLDTQTLELRLLVYGNNVNEVVLVESANMPSARAAELGISDWQIGKLVTEAATFIPFPGIERSSLTARLPARRLLGYYLVQMMIPLILIVAMSWIPFWIDPSVVNTRTNVCVTTVLTLIAYRFMIGNLVPKLPYLTLVDELLLGATVLVALALGTVVFCAHLVRRDRVSTVTRIDAVARVFLPVAFVLLLGLVRFLG